MAQSKLTIQQLEMLVDTTRYLTESLNVKEVLQRIADKAVKLINTQGGIIYLLENDGETLTPAIVVEPNHQAKIRNTPINVKSSLTGMVVQNVQGMIFNNAAKHPKYQPIPDVDFGDECLISVPLIADGIVLGAMSLGRNGVIFTETDLILAETFARYAAVALKNAQSHQTLQLSGERFRQLFENMNNGVVIYRAVDNGQDFIITDFNAAGERIGQIDRRDVIGKSVQIAFPEVKPYGLFDVLQRVWRTGEPEEFPLTYYEDNRQLWRNNYVYKLLSGEIVAVYEDMTKQKQAEIKIRESEKRFRTLFDNLPAACWTFERDGRILEWNRTAERLYGWSAEAVVGKTMFELMVRPENVERTRAGITAVFRGEEVLNREFEDIRSDGETVILLANEYPLWDADGRVVLGICAEIDITQRKMAEIALQENELRYRTLFESINSGVAVYKAIEDGNDFIITDFNRAGEQMGAVDRRDIIGKRAAAAFPNLKKLGLIEAFKRVWRTGKSERFPLVIRSEEGLKGWRDNYIYKLPSGEIVAVHEDVTEQKRAEESRERALGRYQSLVENAPYALAHIQANGVIQYFNPRFTQLFGYDIKDIPNTNVWFKTAYPDSRYRAMAEDAWARVWQQFEDKNTPPPPTILTIRTKDGRNVITRFHRSNLDDGTALIAMEDITLQKETEIALKNSEARLQQAQKMESIGTLAGGIAHDFNNLLTAINGQAELGLLKLKGDHPVRRNLEGVLGAGNRAAKLTAQLLAFSRRQMYRPQMVDINKNVLDSQNILRHLIREDITIETKLAPNLPFISADPHQLEQILINLVVNARDAIYEQIDTSHKKTITIQTDKIELNKAFAETHPGAKPGKYICFCVSDTGVGMDETVRKKIFEPFFTTKPKGRGTGLGMATVYGIVKQNDGYVYVYSEKGRGTTVKIFWTIATDGEAPSVQQKEDTEPLLTGTEMILLVEDDEQVRAFAADSLIALGYTVLVAENGAHALQLVSENKQMVDLLVTDVIMPQMDGPQLAETLHHRWPNLSVLFMSGYTDDLLGKEGAMAHNVQFLQKPFSTRELAKKVRFLLDKIETPPAA